MYKKLQVYRFHAIIVKLNGCFFVLFCLQWKNVAFLHLRHGFGTSKVTQKKHFGSYLFVVGFFISFSLVSNIVQYI